MIVIRRALPGDLPTIVALFALPVDGNVLDQGPTEPLDPAYARALASMEGDSNNVFYVAELVGRVVGTFQLTIIQHVAYRGGRAAQVENVIVDPEVRGRGVGARMMEWAIAEARARDCFRVQLTSNLSRDGAHRFYERLGFVASHKGMKLDLASR